MPEMKVSFLDVGHGDFSFAISPFGHNLIIDVGYGDVIPSVFLKNINTIHELQISHPHTDHFDDIINISKKSILSFRCPNLDSFKDNVIGWKKSDKNKINRLREIKRTIAANNDAVLNGNNFAHTVWFPENVDFNNPNTASIVTTLSYQGVTILYGGDLPSSGWDNLLNKKEFIATIKNTAIFKVPHHGRQEGCSDALFKIISPKLCIISDKSLDKDNQNTVATSWYSARSSGCNVVGYDTPRKVLTTRTDGSIFVKINNEGKWWVYPDTNWEK